MTSQERERLRLEIRGAVQGVGFRPFVYRLAEELELPGWVLNDSRGVTIEVEGPRRRLESFYARLAAEVPPRAVVHETTSDWLEPVGFAGFEIHQSDEAGDKSVVVLPDVATCADCLAEVLDEDDRRAGYPFTNCTNCGPRLSILRALPYDRPNTTMERFEMCPDCAREYGDPGDRRFHAQPNACPVCGPRLELCEPSGAVVATEGEALAAAAAALAEEKIVAVKGLGGFHLMVDAASEAAVTRLRERKGRYGKPLALMVRDLDEARRLCETGGAEELLTGPEAPIVLMPRTGAGEIAEAVAPGNPYLGVMLPYTPLHHLLLRAAGRPVVATSGNLSDEPICTGNEEGLERLGGIADLFLLHDRPIARHVDDSVMAIVEDAPLPIRRARGLAPLPVLLREATPGVLAVGAHQKNVVALAVEDRVFLSQHIGDMETPQAIAAFEGVIRDFLDLYEAEPVVIAHDLHPDYVSSRWARSAAAGRLANDGQSWGETLAGIELVGVQHHHAHLASCLAEHRLDGPALGVTWDGTGLGTDQTIWGGEFLLGDAAGFERVAALRPFRLAGSEAAVKEPRRVALALLRELYGTQASELAELAPVQSISEGEKALLERMLGTGFQAPITTSAGRLFDGIAAIVGLRQRVAFEGQAAMELEFVAAGERRDAYSIELRERPPSAPDSPHLELDWRPLLAAVVEDVLGGVDAGIIAMRFHGALADAVGAVAEAVGQPRVVLTGGCFQNRLLTELCRERLEPTGFEVVIHREVPPNDGGISLGQVAVASARFAAGAGEKH